MMRPKNTWTESAVFERLRHAWPSPAHIRLPGVRNGTGWSRERTRTADAIVMSVWPSRGLWIAGVEIKVSRSDWKKELADAEKAADLSQYCDYWYVPAPEGIVPHGEVPETWGLIECRHNTAVIVRGAPKSEAKPIDLPFLAAILRKVEDCTVSAGSVAELVREQVEQRTTAAVALVESEKNALQERIHSFQEVSGVDIGSPWALGNIADAVKLIASAGSVEYALDNFRRQNENVLKISEKIAELIGRAGGGDAMT